MARVWMLFCALWVSQQSWKMSWTPENELHTSQDHHESREDAIKKLFRFCDCSTVLRLRNTPNRSGLRNLNREVRKIKRQKRNLVSICWGHYGAGTNGTKPRAWRSVQRQGYSKTGGGIGRVKEVQELWILLENIFFYWASWIKKKAIWTP